MAEPDSYDALVVGAGFAGLYALHRLRGQRLRTRVLEAGSGVGGVWFWNRYPGARCDIESLDYSYSFSPELQQEWEWSERYPSQPELLRYLDHVADRFDLRRDIELETVVTAATYDESTNRWTVETARGERLTTRFLVMATGCLSVPQLPEWKGLEEFEGEWLHTATWPDPAPSFAGKVVGVIGTGSSGVQVIPQLAAQAQRVIVFQRTPNHVVPAHNRPLDPDELRRMKDGYDERRRVARERFFGTAVETNLQRTADVDAAERRRIYEERWELGGFNFLASFVDMLADDEANAHAAEFLAEKVRATVADPAVAERLVPAGHPVGTKRICVGVDYYETFNRDDVELVDVAAAPIEAITARGLRTTEAQYELDAIVFATGFDAMTGALMRIDICGRDGRLLRDAWAHGPRTYLGLTSAGFPNLFVVAGPGSPSVLSNVPLSIEQHVDWIGDCIAHLEASGLDCVEATPDAEDAWVRHVNEAAEATLFRKARSWYVGANTPGKAQVFMPYVGGVPAYAQILADVVAKGYEGFVLSRRGRAPFAATRRPSHPQRGDHAQSRSSQSP